MTRYSFTEDQYNDDDVRVEKMPHARVCAICGRVCPVNSSAWAMPQFENPEDDFELTRYRYAHLSCYANMMRDDDDDDDNDDWRPVVFQGGLAGL